jgi:dihydrofolate reductase
VTIRPRITLAAAVARNGVIGAGGRLPWRASDDLRRFKALTLGHPVIMGRTTFESIGRALPGRVNIVLTRTSGWRAPETVVAADFDAAIACAGPAAEIFVIGGAEVYAAALGRADRIQLTRIDADVEGDVRFPALAPGEWRRVFAGSAEKGPRNDYPCRFFVLERLKFAPPL